MTRLRELRLHGFKSFADPTSFVFESGINAVIGPNGSGKSNMADALRWVLGEQSNRWLRTRRADDVIFAGSQGRKALGMAEAVLVLDNADGWLPIEYGEVSIARRAYGSGESEYLINGAKVRLRDVVDLLAAGRLGANELVVVGQGTVDAALSLRPEERRQLFEEAAGVKNLQVRKNEALARLARAEDNLARVRDVLGELRPQLRRLSLQAKHQQEHAGLVRLGRELVSESHRRREQAEREALGDARRQAASATAALAEFRAEQAAGRSSVSAAEGRYWAADAEARAAAELREARRETLIRAEARIEAAETRLADAEATMTTLAQEASALEVQLGEAPPSGGVDGAAELEAAQRAAAEAHAAWEVARSVLAERDARLLDAEEQLAGARRADMERLAAEASVTERSLRAAARREQLDDEIVLVRAALSAAADAVAAARAREEASAEQLRAATVALADAEAAEEAARIALDAGQAASTRIAQQVSALQAELAALEGSADPGRALSGGLREAGWRDLLGAIEAPPEAWVAIEAVIGGAIDGALVWRGDDLGEHLAGADGAVPLLEVRARGAVDTAERRQALDAVGAARTLADLLGGELVPTLFERVALVDDRDRLLTGWQQLPIGWSAVTIAGDLADARGLVRARGRRGSGRAEAAGRRRPAEVRDALAAAETAHASAQEAAARLQGERDAARVASSAALAAAREHQTRLAGDRVGRETAEAQQARVEHEHDGLRTEIERLVTTVAAAAPSQEGGATSIARLEGELTVARARRADAVEARDAARIAWASASQAAAAAEARTGPQRGQRPLLESRLAELGRSADQQRSAVDRARSDLEALREILADAKAADDEAAGRVGGADTARETERANLLAMERALGDGGARLGELEDAAQAAAVAVSRREESLNAISRERDLALASLPDAGPEPEPRMPAAGEGPADAEDRAPVVSMGETELEDELRRVRRTLQQIGSVNPFAVDEHREISVRLGDLESQDADLTAAVSATRQLIERLEREIGERFQSAFSAIATRFDEYCRLLFAGGSATLQLAEPGDTDAPGGIEIAVQPPGKRLQRLSMLSGGERALTGVALLFAMLDVNPIPFCILDEVDAALDEANIGRFAQALQLLSAKTSFVVITHNRATIEVADTIYGVTMTEAAVSRVVSLRLADLPTPVAVG